MQLHNAKFPSVNIDPGEPDLVNGRGLAHRRLTRKQRLRLAADLATRRRRLDPSLGQISLLLGVPAPAIRAEVKARTAQRENGQAKTADVLPLVHAWDNASEDERREAVLAIGPAQIWDVLAAVIA
jgi:hypothetical protein